MEVILSFKRHQYTHKKKQYFLPDTLLCKKNNQIDIYEFDKNQLKITPHSAFSMVYIYDHYDDDNKKIVMKLMTKYNEKIKQEINFYKYISNFENYNLYICKFENYITETYKNNTYHYLILEHLHQDLFDFMFTKKIKYTLYDVISILKQVAKSLHFLHSHNIIYNDLKIENIMISKNRPWKIKLIDFNCITSLKNHANLYTNCGSGTLSFMSPELQNCISKNKYNTLTITSDSWGFGLLICMLLTHGLNLFENKSNKRTIENIKKNKFQEKKEIFQYFNKNSVFKQSKYVKKLILLCNACIQTNPKERPSLKKISEHLQLMCPDI